MSFGRIKIDPADKLYSQIIRFGKIRCQRCGKFNKLQCAHIIGRAHKTTRWMLKPLKNAIALCMPCHSWFDSCKDDTPIFKPEARQYFSSEKNAYAFLVEEIGYSWEDLAKLYYLGHRTTKDGPFDKVEIRRQLKTVLKELEK